MNVPSTHAARQKQKGGALKTALLSMAVATGVTGLVSCSNPYGEDTVSSGRFVQNGDATSLNDIDSTSALVFLGGMLDAVNTPRAGEHSDAVGAFDNLTDFIRINIQGKGDKNKVNFTIDYGDGKEIRYAISVGENTVTIQYRGVGGMSENDSFTLSKHPTNKTVYLVDPNNKNKRKTPVNGDEIRNLIDSAVPNNAI